MKGNEEGASELIDETLIIAMGLVLAVVTLMLVSGVIPLTEKTAYLVPQFGVGNVSGHTVITIFNRGGEPVYFNGSPQAKYKAELYVNTQSGSYKAVPAPALTVFKPGDTMYAYCTGSGFILTNTLFRGNISVFAWRKDCRHIRRRNIGCADSKGGTGAGSNNNITHRDGNIYSDNNNCNRDNHGYRYYDYCNRDIINISNSHRDSYRVPATNEMPPRMV